MLEVELAGEPVVLLGDRALLWPAGRAAIVADLHLGKDDAFRRHGIALPAGAAARDFARLDRLVRRHAPTRLVVLGDFFHAAPRPADDFHAEFTRFRDSHPDVEIDVVAGNHDRHGGIGSLADAVTWHADGLALGPFELRHEPRSAIAAAGGGAHDAAGAGSAAGPGSADGAAPHVLAGHVHPVVVLAAGGDRARLPCFWSRAGCTVLPAFGSLTGGHAVHAGPGERVHACVGERVVAIPGR